MHLLEGLMELIAPTRCAGCELPGALLCAACDEAMPRVVAAGACLRCGAPYGRLVCTECWSSEYAFERAVALAELDGPVSRAVVLHKDAGERRLGELLGGFLGRVVFEAWGRWADAVTWIPPTDAAIRKRGFDHGEAIAQPVARSLDTPCVALLRRGAARDQRRLGRSERSANSKGTFQIEGTVPTRILVVDDVMTTGSTLDAAACALLDGGATSVRVAVIARCW